MNYIVLKGESRPFILPVEDRDLEAKLEFYSSLREPESDGDHGIILAGLFYDMRETDQFPPPNAYRIYMQYNIEYDDLIHLVNYLKSRPPNDVVDTFARAVLFKMFELNSKKKAQGLPIINEVGRFVDLLRRPIGVALHKDSTFDTFLVCE
ncbi:hypothetical protein DRN75_01440 [Nanoarchaeota archaeon]|nr:MAG: hypothetical protein DRN75_01440 [Nanoarchaeota archaeon]